MANHAANKIVSVTLALFLASSAFMGCTDKNSSSDKNSVENKDVSVTKPGNNRPEKITAMFDSIVKKEDGQDAIIREYKKQTGIELVIIQPPHNQYAEKVRMVFASNDLPDVVETDADNYVRLAAQGAFVQVNDYIDKSEALNKIDRVYIDAIRFRDGKIYGFPLSQGGGTVTYLRKDWLDNLGLKVPTTWDELYGVMKAFTLNDPDRNGKDDTVGYTAAGFGTGSEIFLRDFYQNATPEFTQINGKWVDGFLQPEFKDALQRLKKAYADKVLDQEVFTNQTSTAREKFYAGRVGMINYWSGLWASKLEHNTKKFSVLWAEVLPIPVIKGSYYYNRVAPIHAISKSAKNPEGIFKGLIEFMHDGDKGQMLFAYGIEGVHYAKDGDKLINLSSSKNPEAGFNNIYTDIELQLVPWKTPVRLDKMTALSREINVANMKHQVLLPLSDTYAKRASDIAKLREEVIAKVMIGELTVDTGVDAYRQRSKALYVDQILSEFNK